ncbi:MAG: putative dsRNA-binding protein, partial [Candidatus Gastranaerophilales bacterium]|nr:putative dsRNA-binding protein [Candidatus Gastranaerophilales bacterium]
LTYFKDDILNVEYSNPKAKLQELTQKLTHNLPEYIILDEKGPDHDKIFTSGVYYEGKLIAKGEAKSRKLAEINAAKQALIVLWETRQND